MKSSKTLLWIVVVALITTLFGNTLVRYIGGRDTCGVEVGMSFEEYANIIPQERRLDFYGYSFFKNDFGYPVLIRYSDEKIVLVQREELSQISNDASTFEKLTAGMPILEVVQKVGIPGGIAKADEQTLVYSGSDGTSYLMRYVLTDGDLYLESVTAVKTEQDA